MPCTTGDRTAEEDLRERLAERTAMLCAIITTINQNNKLLGGKTLEDVLESFLKIKQPELSDNQRWLDQLPKPFKPGMVVPYQTGWAFTFVAGDHDYTWRNVTYKTAAECKTAMREFVQRHNSQLY